MSPMDQELIWRNCDLGSLLKTQKKSQRISHLLTLSTEWLLMLCPSSRKRHILNLDPICEEPFISKRKWRILSKWLIPCLGRRDKLSWDRLTIRSNADEQAQQMPQGQPDTLRVDEMLLIAGGHWVTNNLLSTGQATSNISTPANLWAKSSMTK